VPAAFAGPPAAAAAEPLVAHVTPAPAASPKAAPAIAAATPITGGGRVFALPTGVGGFPEGIPYDETGDFYVGSTIDGTIFRGIPRQDIRETGGEYRQPMPASTGRQDRVKSRIVPAPSVRRSGDRACLLAVGRGTSRPTNGTSVTSWSPRPNRLPTNPFQTSTHRRRSPGGLPSVVDGRRAQIPTTGMARKTPRWATSSSRRRSASVSVSSSSSVASPASMIRGAIRRAWSARASSPTQFGPPPSAPRSEVVGRVDRPPDRRHRACWPWRHRCKTWA
jgi:hypothetical protein